MKNVILRNGLIAGLGLFIVNLLLLIFVGEKMPFKYAEVVGWLLIILACSFVFIGIRQFRDGSNGGRLSFGEALKVGAGIALFPSVGIFIFEVLLWTFWGDGFLNYYKEGARQTMSPEDFAKMTAEIDSNPMMMNPFFQGSVMFATVLLTGLVVAVVAGIFLKKGE